jgi:serine/threonine-protein kinase RIO1
MNLINKRLKYNINRNIYPSQKQITDTIIDTETSIRNTNTQDHEYLRRDIKRNINRILSRKNNNTESTTLKSIQNLGYEDG